MLFVCSLALISCASEAVGVRCTPGQVVECPCGGGARGVQSCADNGAYGACTCADAAPPGVDADGASATPDVAGDVVNVMDGPADVEPSRDVTDAGADASTDDGAEAAADVVAADVVAADVVAADLAEELGCSSGALCGGRCVDVAADLRHCGRCGNDCAALTGVDPTAARCVGGACRIEGACLPSRAHCSSNPQDGCETDVTTPARCGDCSTRCAEPAPLCSLLVDAAGRPSRTPASAAALRPLRRIAVWWDLRRRHDGPRALRRLRERVPSTAQRHGDVSRLGSARLRAGWSPLTCGGCAWMTRARRPAGRPARRAPRPPRMRR